MEIGISTACFYPALLEDAVKEALALGFKKLEVFFNTASEYEPAFVDELGRCVRDAGASVVSVHSYSAAFEGFLFFSGYERRVRDAIELYRPYFAAGAALGARYFTFHGERRFGLHPESSGGQDNPDLPSEHTFEGLSRLCQAAQEEGITLSQENVVWCRSSSPAYIKTLREAVPALCYTLDFKQARRAGRELTEYMDAMGDGLVNIHLNDCNETESCLLPTYGNLNYEQLFSDLRRRGYSGDCLIEVYSHNYCSVNELKNVGFYLQNLVNL